MENIEKEVLELIEFIKQKMKEMNLDAEDVFLNGNCGDLYKIFVSKFSKYTTPFLIKYRNQPYHIVTRIQNKFYDITGETDLKKYTKYVKEKNKNYSFDEKSFEMEQLSVSDYLLYQMCGKYDYDENFGESKIHGQMSTLVTAVKEFGKENQH